MKYRYSKYVADLAGDIDLESLMSRLSELLLASGFENPWDPQSDDERTMQALHDAILEALLSGDVQNVPGLEDLTSEELQELINKLVERLSESGYVTIAGPPNAQRFSGPGQGGGPQGQVKGEQETGRETAGQKRAAGEAVVCIHGGPHDCRPEAACLMASRMRT